MKHKASCAVYDPCPSACDCGALTDYQLGFQAGAASERIITLQDDDNLRFIKRVLESDDFTAQDKVECLRLIHAIRTRIRGGYTDDI